MNRWRVGCGPARLPIRETLDQSIERQKEKDDFLHGAAAVVEALRRKRIECRVYARNKFHAKAYITHARHAVVGASALVGSSNFTRPGLPGRVFSGKAGPKPDSRAVFFCYILPGRAPAEGSAASGEDRWDADRGLTAWYLFDLGAGRIVEDPAEIMEWIRCTPETPRVTALPRHQLSEIRARIEKHVRDTHLKRVQAPAGVRPTLKCWMELS